MKARPIILRKLDEAEYYYSEYVSHCFKFIGSQPFLLDRLYTEWRRYESLLKSDLSVWTKVNTQQFKLKFPDKPL
jgi:hypothetical protein